MVLTPVRGIRQLVAPNPSPMTGPGTNGYIVGCRTVAIVDPGPDDDRHLAAWLDALRGETVSHILVTHAHLDHSALSQRLSRAVAAPIFGYGRWDRGRSETMRRLEGLGGGEGVDRLFEPDVQMSDGDVISGPGWQIETLHTPGHFSGHLAFATDQCVLTGDHVLGWSSTLISPPDGDLRRFLESCDRLKEYAARSFLPGHGDPISNPAERLSWLVNHRLARDAQITRLMRTGELHVPDLVRHLYSDTPRHLWPAASRNVLAHLIAMVEDGRATADPRPGPDARFRLT